MPRKPRRATPVPSTAPGIASLANRAITLVVLAGLIGAGGWAYASSFRGVFVGDDVEGIVLNQHVKRLWPLTESMGAPADSTVAGRPVASLTLAINYAIAPADVRDAMTPAARPGPPDVDPFLRNVWGYHAFNLAIHLASALTLFGVVRRTLERRRVPKPGSETRLRNPASLSTQVAFAVALLWVVHPLTTSAVTYVIQRVESLMGLFYLLTLYCTIRASALDRRFRWWVAGAIGACALGMATKEVMVSAPIMAALGLWICARGPDAPVNRFNRRFYPLIGGLAATWIVLAVIVSTDVRPQSVGFGLGDWTWWSYLRTQSAIITHYLRLVFDPTSLAFTYAWRPASSWIEILPQFVFISLLAAVGAFAIWRRHPAGLLAAWFFLILAPSSSVLPIPTEVAAEHRMYLPLAAVIVAVVLGAVHLGRRVTARPRSTVVAWTAVALAAITLGTITHARNRDYWSVEWLMRDTVIKRPLNAEARTAYGAELLKQMRFHEAEEQLRSALTIPQAPGTGVLRTALAHSYLGAALCAQDRLDEGISHLQQAIALNDRLGEAYAALGTAYATQGRVVEAAAAFDRAVTELPDLPPVLSHAAVLLATAPDPSVRNGPRAVHLAERAVQLTGARDWTMLDALAVVYASAGRLSEAVSTEQRAIAVAQASGDSRAVAELQRRLAVFQGR